MAVLGYDRVDASVHRMTRPLDTQREPDLPWLRPGPAGSVGTACNHMVTEWRVHVGAHKTATTHLQYTLQAALADINAHGGNFVPTPELRSILAGQPRQRWRRRAGDILPAARPLLLRRETERLLRHLSRHVRVRGPMAFSEENLLGTTRGILGGTLYPRLWRMHLIAQLSRVAPLHLFLTIRSLDAYLPSAYAEALKGAPLSRAEFREAVALFAARSHHWTGLLARLGKIAPHARIEVWNFDDYSANWRELHRTLIGVPLTEFPHVPPPSRTRTPGAAAILLAEADRTPRGPARAQGVRELYVRDIEEGQSTRFDPLSADEKAHFRSLYREDLDAMRQTFPGALRHF